ncbi:MAG: biopolymer transporter ExbD [Reichenbachiella sp.]
MKKLKRKTEELNVSSTADIAFLLLIFFLVSTTILMEKGLSLKLPPKVENETIAQLNSRNLFKIQINSKNQLLVNNEVVQHTGGLNDELKTFILNRGKNEKLSDSPTKAIISIKTNRGTDYEAFIEILDVVKGAYYDIYADRVGMTSASFLNLNLNKPNDHAQYISAREGIPMNISIAEPN